MKQIKDKNASSDQMLMIEKQERVIAYLYPIIQRTPRQHGVLRDKMLACLFDTADYIMQMRFSKWCIAPISRGINFLGYRIWPRHKLMRKQSVTRAKRAIKSLKAREDVEALNRFLAAWTGHASWADTQNLMAHLEAA